MIMLDNLEEIDKYKEKEYKAGKCKWKYFWQGFKNSLIFHYKPSFYCPFCCSKISEKEYYQGTIFIIGCKYCKEKK
jgi:hypothetical protein